MGAIDQTIQREAKAAKAAPIPPTSWVWDGDVMVPARPKLADRYFVVHQVYTFVEHHERSSAAHAHFFATFKELWESLPDELVLRWPHPDQWRKHLLIRTGFCDTKTVVCGSNAEARRWAAIISADYDLVEIRDRVVTMWKAHSQSYPAMDKKTFTASSEAVLRAAGDMLEVFHEPTVSSTSQSGREPKKLPAEAGA